MKKRIVSVALAICMLLVSIPMNEQKVTADQSSTWEESTDLTPFQDETQEVYVVETPEQVAGLAYLVNTGQRTFLNKTIILGADIDLGEHEWIPIDYSGSANGNGFWGTFDGNGHTISNMSITTDYNEIGFFGHCDGIVKNLNLIDIYISADAKYIGGVVGGLITTSSDIQGTVTNCKVTGRIISKSEVIDGIVGCCIRGNTEVTSNTDEVNIISSESWDGLADTTPFEDEGATTYYIDNKYEFAGFNLLSRNGNTFEGKTIEIKCDLDMSDFVMSSFNDFAGTLNGNGHMIVGVNITDNGSGLFSKVTGTVKNLFIEIDITSNSSSLGGIAGTLTNEGSIDNCVVYGSITSTCGSGDCYEGGIVGCIHDVGIISNCICYADISLLNKHEVFTGGIVGCAYVYHSDNTITISGCRFEGDISSKYSGGIVGYVRYNKSITNEIKNVFISLKNCSVSAESIIEGSYRAAGFIAYSYYMNCDNYLTSVVYSYCSATILSPKKIAGFDTCYGSGYVFYLCCGFYGILDVSSDDVVAYYTSENGLPYYCYVKEQASTNILSTTYDAQLVLLLKNTNGVLDATYLGTNYVVDSNGLTLLDWLNKYPEDDDIAYRVEWKQSVSFNGGWPYTEGSLPSTVYPYCCTEFAVGNGNMDLDQVGYTEFEEQHETTKSAGFLIRINRQLVIKHVISEELSTKELLSFGTALPAGTYLTLREIDVDNNTYVGTEYSYIVTSSTEKEIDLASFTDADGNHFQEDTTGLCKDYDIKLDFSDCEAESYETTLIYVVQNDCTSIDGNTYSNDKVSINGTIKYSKDNEVTVNASAGEHGSITPVGENVVVEGSDISYSVIPNRGYKISSILINDIESVESYSTDGAIINLTNVTEDLDIEVTFTPYQYQITAPDNSLCVFTSSDNLIQDYGASYQFTVEALNGYAKSDDFEVRVNIELIMPDEDGVYTIDNIMENKTIEVSGIVDNIAPTASISISTSSWNEFLDTIKFDRFYNLNENVSISANDSGVGMDQIYYYIAKNQMTLTEVKEISEWNQYSSELLLSNNQNYVIYVKAVDLAGNIKYISSDGLVYDDINPYISQIENNCNYYNDATFSFSDLNLDSVTVDEELIDITTGTYTIIADNQQHTIVITDLAGNKTEYTIGVYQTYSVELNSLEGVYSVKAVDGSTSPVNYGGTYTFEVVINENYKKSSEFKVLVNGEAVTLDENNQYVISNVTENQSITVEGVTIDVPPTGDSSRYITALEEMIFGIGLFGLAVLCKKRKKTVI